METKLTLSMEKEVIEKAKAYARKKNTSLSGLIKNYLIKITRPSGKEDDITPLVKSLSGVITLEGDKEHKKAYSEWLNNKYK